MIYDEDQFYIILYHVAFFEFINLIPLLCK